MFSDGHFRKNKDREIAGTGLTRKGTIDSPHWSERGVWLLSFFFSIHLGLNHLYIPHSILHKALQLLGAK